MRALAGQNREGVLPNPAPPEPQATLTTSTNVHIVELGLRLLRGPQAQPHKALLQPP
jgi:hypothetical protein